MKNLKSINILMKNTIIPSNTDGNNNKKGLSPPNNVQTSHGNQISYFRDLVQKTILAVQKYKQLDIIGANELNQATQHLEKTYLELSTCQELLKNKTNASKITAMLEKIRIDLNTIFKQHGTEKYSRFIKCGIWRRLFEQYSLGPI